MFELILVFFGLFLGLILDIIWQVKIKFNKFQSHEHYHVSLELVILYIIISYFTDSIYSLVILGIATALLLGEWNQLRRVKENKVLGNTFAYGSVHFKKSSFIGIVLAGAIVCLLVTGHIYP